MNFVDYTTPITAAWLNNVDTQVTKLGSVTAAQLGYLSNVTSDIQNQINTLSTSVGNKAAKGVNSDITQLTGLTTPLSASQGGTGRTNFLPTQTGNSGKALVTDGNNDSWGYPAQLSTATGNAPSYGCRAWGQVTNNGTTATLSRGGNIASVTRTTVGEVAVVLTTAMPSTSYSVVGMGTNTSIAAGSRSVFIKEGSKTTTGFTLYTVYDGAPTAGQDCNFDFAVFG